VGGLSSPEALAPYLPAELIGAVRRVESITQGLSGAQVWAVTAETGQYVLRLGDPRRTRAEHEQELLVLRRAADAGIAPRLVHVDAARGAVLSVRVLGSPLPAALGNPTQREHVIASIVDQLRTLHALEQTGAAPSDPPAAAYRAWQQICDRPGFPGWASRLEPVFEAAGACLARDARRVLSHNDVNPGNLLWDGARAWLVDWEVAGVTHPYFDLATLSLFLRLDHAVALALVERHDGAAPDPRSRATFHALRQVAALLSGCTILGLVPDLTVLPAPTIADAPVLGLVFRALGAGELELQSPRGQASLGLALLAEGVAYRPPS
jgi:aminoglycoside phosphotransferase (APT) family kinase protein